MNRYEKIFNYDKNLILIGRNDKGPAKAGKQRSTSTLSPGEMDGLREYLASDKALPSSTTPLYLAWKKTIETSGPHSHLFTLAFKRSYCDQEAINALSAWVKMMNKSLSPSWKRNSRGLSGFALAERHSLSVDFRGRLHFHVLVKQSKELCSTQELQSKAYDKALRLRDIRGVPMTDVNRIDLREVTNEPRLIGYLLKDICCSDWRPSDNIALISPSTGLDGFQFDPLSSMQLIRKH